MGGLWPDGRLPGGRLTAVTAIEPVARPVVLVVTDSLGFPRAEPERVEYRESYVGLLRAAFPQYDIVHFGQGGATIERLFNYTSYYHHTLTPVVCFMQSGIVDCAPRALTEIEIQVLNRLPVLGSPISRLVKRHANRIRRMRKLYYTPLARYEAAVERFEATFTRVQWITVPAPTSEYEASVPGISAQVRLYNAVLKRRLHIPTDDFDTADMMSDHHHLSVSGHRKLFLKLAEALNNLAPVAP